MFTGLIQRIGTVKRVSRGAGLVLEIAADKPWANPLEPGESIAVNGVSLTVSGLGPDWLRVDVIPTTASATTLGTVRVGDKVNLESDVLGRYAIRGGGADEPSGGGLTMEKLAENGFL